MNTEGYTKLASSILTSTIWVESDQTVRVWITILALCDRTGFVSGTIPGLANVARVTVEDCRTAIDKFLGPDPDSRTEDNEGRRLQKVDGGWLVLNFLKYRADRDPETRRTQNRLAKQRERARYKQSVECQPMSANVSPNQPGSAQAEAEAKAKAVHPHCTGTLSRGSQGRVSVQGEETDHYHKDSRAALHILNEYSGRSFRETDSNLTFISSRLREPGVDLEGVRKMIERQCQRWKGTDQAEYLRPETLFNKTKFDGYYAARNQPILKNETHKSGSAYGRPTVAEQRNAAIIGAAATSKRLDAEWEDDQRAMPPGYKP